MSYLVSKLLFLKFGFVGIVYDSECRHSDRPHALLWSALFLEPSHSQELLQQKFFSFYPYSWQISTFHLILGEKKPSFRQILCPLAVLSHPLASTGMKLCLLFTVEDKNASLSGRNKRKATMKECQVSRCGI